MVCRSYNASQPSLTLNALVKDGKNDGEDVHMTNADAVKIQQATLDEEHQHNAVGAEVLIMNSKFLDLILGHIARNVEIPLIGDLDASKMTHADAVTSTKYHENGRLKKRLKLDESVTEPANDQTSNPNRDDNVPTTSTETLQIEPVCATYLAYESCSRNNVSRFQEKCGLKTLRSWKRKYQRNTSLMFLWFTTPIV